MKILYIITKSNWGGAQRHVYDLATAMKTKGHEVVVALGGDGTLRSKLEDASISTRPISGLGRDISVGKDAGSFKDIFSVIRAEKPDILHLHSPKAAGLGAFAGRLLRVKKIVYTVHGWAFNEDRPFHQRAAIVFFSWLTTIFSRTVILLSQKELAQAMRFPFIKDKIVLVPLGIISPILVSVDGAKEAIARRIGITLPEFNKNIVIGTIAELHPNKGLTYLINAMSDVVAEHPNAICVIVGDGQDKASLHMLIKENGLESNIFLVGYMDAAAEYLKAFNIFILPSVKEGLPYTILEAGAASLPVIATTVGGIPEIIDDMKSGVLVQPKNSKELAHAITFMIEHPHLRREYGSALREKVKKDFSVERMVEETEKVYQK